MKRATPLGHQFGDWVAPDAHPALGGKRGATDEYFIANAYLAESMRITAETASILGDDIGFKELNEQHLRLIEHIREEYFTPNGRMVSETQTACVLALRFDIVPEKHRVVVIETLKHCIGKHKGKLSTGFAATQYLLPTLVENGLQDEADKLLLNTECPSWLYEVRHGATTVWERWNSVLPDGKLFEPEMNSFNHYASASVGSYVYRTVAGIAVKDAGYKKFTIAPHPC